MYPLVQAKAQLGLQIISHSDADFRMNQNRLNQQRVQGPRFDFIDKILATK